MNFIRIHFPLSLVLTLIISLLPSLVQSAPPPVIDINKAITRKTTFAVPWFENKDLGSTKQKLGRDLALVLSQALTFHGYIDVIPTEKYSSITANAWKTSGADFAITGKYSISSEKIKLELRLHQLAAGDMRLGKSYNGSINQKYEMLFKYTDTVIKELTGKPGIASTQIAYVSQPKNQRAQEVFITDILGKKHRQVTRHQNLIVSPRMSADGNFLTYSSYHSGNQNLYITDLRQSRTTQALSRRKGMNLAPAWSPNGKQLILTLSVNGNPDLFMIDRQGKIIRQLTRRSGINVSPTYSPDGKHIVFVSDRSRKPQLYLMKLSDGSVTRLTYQGSENAEPSWSPTEDLIVYSSLRNGIYQICTLNPFMENSSIQITKDQSHHESPAFSPDGNQIIFAKKDGNKHKIYGIMKDGNFQRPLFSVPGSQSYPQWAQKNY
ncbi:MAG: protein TolB [Desulfobulbaceae bacterium]|nr:MAG: protein TolB [Desulfobulbaceae bacterium]